MGVASPMGLAILKACRTRLKELVMGSGKSHGTCHFQSVSRQAEMVSYGEWQVPWDLPLRSVSRQAEIGSYGDG